MPTVFNFDQSKRINNEKDPQNKQNRGKKREKLPQTSNATASKYVYSACEHNDYALFQFRV